MFHAQVRRIHQFIAVFVERVGAEPVFKGLHHPGRVFELFPGFLQVLLQYPIIHVQLSVLTGVYFTEVNIFSDIGNDVVVIDGIGNRPVVRSRAILVDRLPAKRLLPTAISVSG